MKSKQKTNIFWGVIAIVITAAVLITVFSIASIGEKQTINTEGFYEVTAEPDKAIIIIEFETNMFSLYKLGNQTISYLESNQESGEEKYQRFKEDNQSKIKERTDALSYNYQKRVVDFVN